MRGHHAFEACVEQLATAIRLGVYPRRQPLPPERELAERLGGPAADAARGDRRAARGRAGRDHAAAAAAARSSRLRPAAASARAAAPDLAGDEGGVARRPGVPPGRRARRRVPRREPRRSTTTDRDDCCDRGGTSGRRRRQAGRAPAGRLALPPHDRLALGLAAADRGRDRRCRPRLHEMLWRSRCSSPTSPTPTASTPRSCKAILAGRRRPGPARSWRNTATTRPRCCAACSAD